MIEALRLLLQSVLAAAWLVALRKQAYSATVTGKRAISNAARSTTRRFSSLSSRLAVTLLVAAHAKLPGWHEADRWDDPLHAATRLRREAKRRQARREALGGNMASSSRRAWANACAATGSTPPRRAAAVNRVPNLLLWGARLLEQPRQRDAIIHSDVGARRQRMGGGQRVVRARFRPMNALRRRRSQAASSGAR